MRLTIHSSFLMALVSSQAFAADGIEAATKLDSGDTAWVLVACAMVLFMTPGLAFFYGGMVRAKNVVSTLFQNYMAIAFVGLTWVICGYSLAFSTEGGAGPFSGFIGDFSWFFLNGVGQEPNATYAPTVPHLAFMMYQCMGAIITPALFTGAFAERVRFKSWLFISVLWSLGVFAPVAHWVWGKGGWLHAQGALDFAGGMVVHMAAGYAALVCALVFGKRRDFGQEMKPYDSGLVLLGTGILWFGWFGFNAGSAMGANGLASHAVVSTFIAGAAGLISWTLADWKKRGKPSAIGAAIGAVVGLIVITPGAGFVSLQAALFMGLCGGWCCNYACSYLKERLQIDDSLDVFGCHGIGGTLGVLMTGLFASKDVNPAGENGLLHGNPALFQTHLVGAVAVALFSAIGTLVVIRAVEMAMKVRVSESEESAGLDASEHDECINSNVSSPVKPVEPVVKKAA